MRISVVSTFNNYEDSIKKIIDEMVGQGLHYIKDSFEHIYKTTVH